MNAETEMSSVRFSWWNSGGNNQIRAEWSGQAIPDELVHNVLGRVRPFVGQSVGRVDGDIAVSLDVRITFSNEEIPF